MQSILYGLKRYVQQHVQASSSGIMKNSSFITHNAAYSAITQVQAGFSTRVLDLLL